MSKTSASSLIIILRFSDTADYTYSMLSSFLLITGHPVACPGWSVLDTFTTIFEWRFVPFIHSSTALCNLSSLCTALQVSWQKLMQILCSNFLDIVNVMDWSETSTNNTSRQQWRQAWVVVHPAHVQEVTRSLCAKTTCCACCSKVMNRVLILFYHVS